jgi:threonine/homoserine/homoserine lactone efflux protein
MSWSKYAEFGVFAVVLVLIPGPDFAVVTRNTVLHGARRLLARRKVRRTLDATTGALLLAFSARLATDHA